VKALESFLERQKRELVKAQGLLNDMDEQVKGVQVTRDEVQNMINGGIRSATPEVEPPVVEALTPPPTTEVLQEERKIDLGDGFAGLDNLDPEVVALLKAELMTKPPSVGNRVGNTNKNGAAEDGYAP